MEEPDGQPMVTAASVRQWAEQSLEALGEARAAIDALNVFPVPDGDTGTNMFLTFEAACAAVAEACDQTPSASLERVADAMTTGALLGARGNSGVILAQIVKGVASVLAEAGDRAAFDADLVRAALQRASDQAYAAVAQIGRAHV